MVICDDVYELYGVDNYKCNVSNMLAPIMLIYNICYELAVFHRVPANIIIS